MLKIVGELQRPKQRLPSMARCLVLVTVLSGCAQYQWHKQGAAQVDFNRDSYECQMEAARVYPTLVVTQGMRMSASTDCSGSTYGNTTRVNCSTTPAGYFPGTERTVDVNAGNRSRAAAQCMNARGWQLIRVK